MSFIGDFLFAEYKMLKTFVLEPVLIKTGLATQEDLEYVEKVTSDTVKKTTKFVSEKTAPVRDAVVREITNLRK